MPRREEGMGDRSEKEERGSGRGFAKELSFGVCRSLRKNLFKRDFLK